MATIDELTQQVNTLTSRLNSIVANSKNIEDLTLADILNFDSFLMIRDDSVSKKMTLQTLADNLNNNYQAMNTGFLSGLELSINADNTKFDVASGYYISTDYTDPLAPVPSVAFFAGQLAVTPTYLTTNNATYIALDANGAIIQSLSPFTNENRRTYCIIGAVIHSNLTNINVINEIKAPVLADTNQLHDLIRAMGSLNIEGNLFTANGANLSLNKSEGTLFALGINAHDYLNPHTTTLLEQILITFRYRLRGGTEYADTTALNPLQYDLNDVLTTVATGKFTIQRVNIFQSGIVRTQYGQKEYANMADAVLYLQVDPFIIEQNIKENALFMCYVILKKEVVDLTAAIANGTARIITVSKFGHAII